MVDGFLWIKPFWSNVGATESTIWNINEVVSVLFQPESSSTNKWQLDSWLNKVQAQTKSLVPAQPEHNGQWIWNPKIRLHEHILAGLETHSSSFCLRFRQPGSSDFLSRDWSTSSGGSCQDQALWIQLYTWSNCAYRRAQGHKDNSVVCV